LKVKTAFIVGLPFCALLSMVLFAQSASSTRDGVYTADQAEQGHVLYTKQCALCHDAAQQSAGQIPPLTGDTFLQNWNGQTVADLYGKIQTTMPSTHPGSLKPDEVAQLVAYILSLNNYPAGKTPLPTKPESLQTIHIEMPLSGAQ